MPDKFLSGLVIALFLSLYASTTGIGIASALLLVGGVWFYRHDLKDLPKQPLFFPLGVFAMVVFLSVVFASSYPASKPLGKLRYYALYFILLLVFLRDLKLSEKIDRFAIPVGIVLGVIAILQSFWGLLPMKFLGLGDLPVVPQSNGSFYHARGFLFHHVPFGFNCVLLYHWLFGPLLSKGWKESSVPHKLATGFLAIAVVLSFSRGAWLAFIASNLLVVFALWGKAVWKFVLGLVLVCGIAVLTVPQLKERAFAIHPDQNQERITLWKICYRMFSDSPLLGQGFHSFAFKKEAFATDAEKALPHFPVDPHSMYLDVLSGTGALGMAAFLWLLIAAFFIYFKALYRSSDLARGRLGAGIGAFAAFCVGGFFDSHNVITYTLVATIFYLAAAQSQTQSYRN